MVCTVADVVQWMQEWAPEATAEPRDNVGLHAGSRQAPVSSVLIALDVTDEAIEQARRIGAQMLVTHHPLLYRTLSAITDDSPVGALALQAIQAGIALYAAHTNLDRATGGVNDALCGLLGFQGRQPAENSIERIAQLTEPMTLHGLAEHVRAALGAPAVRVSGEGSRAIDRMYIVSGSGRHDVEAAAQAGCEALLTGELDYHAALAAGQLGLATVEAGHDFTERPVLSEIERYLQKQAKRLQYTLRTEVFLPVSCPFWYVTSS